MDRARSLPSFKFEVHGLMVVPEDEQTIRIRETWLLRIAQARCPLAEADHQPAALFFGCHDVEGVAGARARSGRDEHRLLPREVDVWQTQRLSRSHFAHV